MVPSEINSSPDQQIIVTYISDNCVIMWYLPQFCGRHHVVKQLKSKTPKACYMVNMQICTMLLVSPWFISPAWNTRSDNYFRDALFQWFVSISNWSCGNNILIEMSWGMMGLHSFECVMFADCFVILWHAMLLSNPPAWRNMGIYAIDFTGYDQVRLISLAKVNNAEPWCFLRC